MTKLPFFLFAYYSSTNPHSRHYLKFIIPRKDGEEGRDEATVLQRVGGGGGGIRWKGKKKKS